MTGAPEPTDKLDAIANVERTGGRDPRLGRHRLARLRGERTAAAAADLHGVKGGRPRTGPPVAEADAPLALQHASQRAAGDGAQRWSHDGRR
jgi:hypothetical protein